MATFELPLGLGMPDSSGSVYPSTVEVEADLAAAKQTPCMVYGISATDFGVELGFKVPKNYVGTPKIILCGVLNGTEAQVMAFLAQTEASSIVDNETFDVAFDTADLAEKDITGYADEDYIEFEITLTPGTGFTQGEWINLKVNRDASEDDCATAKFCCIGIYFQYADA